MDTAQKIIAVDFDGTLCDDTWPNIGKERRVILYRLRKEKENGAKVILWTCRTGEKLEEAIDWCKEHGILFDAVNENLPEIIAHYGGDTRKIVATEYWDDRNVLV